MTENEEEKPDYSKSPSERHEGPTPGAYSEPRVAQSRPQSDMDKAREESDKAQQEE